MMGIFKSELIRKVSILSSVAFVAMGFILSVFISRHIVMDAINGKIDTVNFALDIAVESCRLQYDFDHGKGSSPANLMMTHLNASLNASGASDYKVWDEQGNQISQKLTGSSFSFQMPAGEVSDVTSKRTLSHSIVAADGDTAQKSLRIDALVYYPNSDQTLLVTVLFPYQEIQMHQNTLNINIAMAIGGGLFLLYILLLRILTSTSQTLIRQKDDLDVKNRELVTAYDRLNATFHATVQALADAVDARDPYTSGHAGRVMTYSSAIGREMGLSEKALAELILAAQLHDIGKIGIPDAVLLKPDKLTVDEYDIIKKHSTIGVGILKNVPDLQPILPGVLYHHERHDGKGYPEGLDDAQILDMAKIIAVADSYDAMTTNRPYRSAMSHEQAINELDQNRNTQFDPSVVDAFLRTLEA